MMSIGIMLFLCSIKYVVFQTKYTFCEKASGAFAFLAKRAKDASLRVEWIILSYTLS